MRSISFIKKKIGKSYLVWFQNSNLYLQLEEPAWFVFRKTAQCSKAETIAEEFAIRYNISAEESLSFVQDIRLKIKEMNQLTGFQTQTLQVSADLDTLTYQPFVIHRYKLGNQLISFSFQTRTFEYYIHPLIGHLETEEKIAGMPLFELFSHQGRIIFRFNGQVKGSWADDETHLVKGMIFMFLINVMHNKTDANWLMMVHASAITNGKKTILFSAAPGNGKTTIAALLQARGFQIISDDFVPIDRNSLKAYSFPIAMSVKEGSMELLASLFPTLEKKPLNYISPEKSVRYLPPVDASGKIQEALPVHEFVFIKYDRTVDFVWEELDSLSGIRLLLDQAWVAPTPGNAQIFFDRMTQISFYQLTYSDNEKALDAITNLFDHD